MSTVVEQVLIVDEWRGLYSESWKGVIVDEAFAHPAKFSRALIRKIYDHVIAEGWATKGSSVVDPFGGVALGGFDAMRHGLNWYGCELEAKFVGLGSQNMALWNERYSRMPNWGTARLIQGDSRKLAQVLSGAECCVSSPPYAGNEKSDYLLSEDGKTRRRDVKRGFKQGHGCFRGSETYGQAEGQLGAMKEGDHSIVISSPPFVNQIPSHDNFIAPHDSKKRMETDYHTAYGAAEGQLGAMPEGDLCVTSPPWERGAEGFCRKSKFKDPEAFAAEMASRSRNNGSHGASASAYLAQLERDANKVYGDSAGQLGNEGGETFWSASRLILEQLHQVLAPNAHAVFVAKRFVRDKKIVDFPAQWAQLCEAVGFRLLHDHHALLTEHYGTQGGFESDKEMRIERKSFFRRLSESKGSPRIDYEQVLCFEKL